MEEKKKFKISGVAVFNVIVAIMTAVLLFYFIVSDGGVIDLLRSREGIIMWLLGVALLVFELNTVVDACVTLIYLRSQYPRVRFIDALKITRSPRRARADSRCSSI